MSTTRTTSIPFLSPGGLLFGFGVQALTHVLGRWGARVAALRRDPAATAATAADWNRSLAALVRPLLAIELRRAVAHVFEFYRGLFFRPELPG